MIGRMMCVGIALLAFAAGQANAEDDSRSARALFANPPREFSTAPLWVWNDLLTDEMVLGTLRDLAAQKVRQAFVHPRPGLMTPYLSPEWLRLWKVALAEAERLDMSLWIYDENSYPSGFAGGFVPDSMPEAAAKSLQLKTVRSAAQLRGLATFRIADEHFEDLTARVKSKQMIPLGEYLVADTIPAKASPWYAGKTYVDLLKPGVAEKFMEITFEPYRRQFGDQFGKRVPGAFTDEPRLEFSAGFPWTDDLPTVFQQRWGYDLQSRLPSLAQNLGDWKRVRHNYFMTLMELFGDRWASRYAAYCEKNGLELTGHYWDHDWPSCRAVPDNMAAIAWHHRPGIDCLMNQYAETVTSQFGNVRIVKEVSSVANQLDRRRTLCEAFGASGWDLQFEDMKRIGDWLAVLGINTIDEHLSFISIRGARKTDHPLSFSYHEPWWKEYHVMAEYFTRLYCAMSQGRQENGILVLEPTSTAWLYQPPKEPLCEQRRKRLGEAFFQVLMNLERRQIEYDVGCEDVLARHTSVPGRDRATGAATLTVGRSVYHTIVIPPFTENLNRRTAELLEAFLDAGGRVLCCEEPPALCDGSFSDRVAGLAKKATWRQVASSDLPAALATLEPPVVRPDSVNAGTLFHHRRRLADGDLLLLVNTSADAASSGIVAAPDIAHIDRWDLRSGRIADFPYERKSDGVETRFELPPCGSLLLWLAKTADEKPASPRKPRAAPNAVDPVSTVEIARLEPNVLTLDFLDLTTGGKTEKGIYAQTAARLAFAAVGMPNNPWDHGVQFRDEWISKKFPADSGFEVVYRFKVAGNVPPDLSFVVERPDLYSITCNGKPVRPEPKKWWLDHSFGMISLSERAQTGDNEVRLKASPMTVFHEIQPAYVVGNFVAWQTETGFELLAAGKLTLDGKSWREQGMPFYGGPVSYARRFNVSDVKGRFVVSLPEKGWRGSVAKIMVNGKEAGHIVSRPYECDVTSAMKTGENRVEVIVYGTLKNTLGPHHGDTALGKAWPDAFRAGPPVGPPPGRRYSLVPYGLFETFTLANWPE